MGHEFMVNSTLVIEGDISSSSIKEKWVCGRRESFYLRPGKMAGVQLVTGMTGV